MSVRRRRLSRMPPWSYCSWGVKFRERRAERKALSGPEVRWGLGVEGGRAVGAGGGLLVRGVVMAVVVMMMMVVTYGDEC